GLSDRHGPEPALVGGVVIFAAGLIAAGTAPTMAVLTIGRGIQGFGSGAFIVALYVVVAQHFTPDLQPRVFAAFAGAWVLPALVGPAVAGLMVDHIGWRWVFLSVPILAVVALVLLLPAMRRPVRTAERASHDATASRILWSIVAGASATALHLVGTASFPMNIVYASAGVAGLVMGVPRLLPTGSLRLRPGLPAVIATRGIISGAFISAEVLIPLMLNRERGLSPGTAGLALTAAAVAWSAGSWWQGRDSVSTPRWRIGLYGMLFVTAGIASSALAAFSAVPVYVALLTWALSGLGMGMVMPTLSLLTLSASASGDEGRNTSALQISDALASTVALAVTGTALLALIDLGGVLAYLVGFGAAAALAAFGASRAHRMASVG
ncbi:MAG: MFS transporter, partial [Actinomycetia bacterium]|nr:MFS transporter [Actinomycetes bacterium]